MIQKAQNESSPVSKLPKSVLEVNFLSLQDSVVEPYQRTDAAIRMSQVCGTWRAAALDTPNLWENITIGSDNPAIHKASQCLARSMESPIIVRVRQTRNEFRSGDKGFGSVYELLKPHGNRMKSLDVLIKRETNEWASFKSLDFIAPNLESLTYG